MPLGHISFIIDNGRVEGLHIAAVKFLPLLRRESFGVVLFMNARRIATAIVAAVATHARWAARCVDHQDLRSGVIAAALE